MITEIMIMKPVSPPGYEGPPPRVFGRGSLMSVPLDIPEELAARYIKNWIAIDSSNVDATRHGQNEWNAHAARVRAAMATMDT